MPLICRGDPGLAEPSFACTQTLRDSSWLGGLADKKKAQGWNKRSINTNPEKLDVPRSHRVRGRAGLRGYFSVLPFPFLSVLIPQLVGHRPQ